MIAYLALSLGRYLEYSRDPAVAGASSDKAGEVEA